MQAHTQVSPENTTLPAEGPLTITLDRQAADLVRGFVARYPDYSPADVASGLIIDCLESVERDLEEAVARVRRGFIPGNDGWISTVLEMMNAFQRRRAQTDWRSEPKDSPPRNVV